MYQVTNFTNTATKEVDSQVGLQYVAFGEDYVSDNGVPYQGFGIALNENEYQLLKIPDISTNEQAIMQLAAKMNHLHVSRYHCIDVIEDYLNT